MFVQQSGSYIFDGLAGQIEALVDVPSGDVCGLVIIAHPQPLQGGSAQHKIPHFLARALVNEGWLVVRPNFRGVGHSTGAHDSGLGEAQDLLHLYRQLRTARPELRAALLGFSFGAFVQARVAKELLDSGEIPWRICLIGMPAGEVAGGRLYETPTELPDTLVIHGECDERVPLTSVLNWARLKCRPVVVVPGANHFFAGRLQILRKLVLGHLAV
ncbi:alpha/beta hydrolase [Comamonas testosteroni]|uniref:alpha/beta hydrolase n=1 Tax=Comamonas testosteroni TaxID=285 RepID=UPI0011EF05A0|nr:alpha/beta fold hydrolase [Comamonas testosteroni]